MGLHETRAIEAFKTQGPVGPRAEDRGSDGGADLTFDARRDELMRVLEGYSDPTSTSHYAGSMFFEPMLRAFAKICADELGTRFEARSSGWSSGTRAAGSPRSSDPTPTSGGRCRALTITPPRAA